MSTTITSHHLLFPDVIVAVGSVTDKAGRSMALVIIRPRGGPAISSSTHSSRIPVLSCYPSMPSNAHYFVHWTSGVEAGLNVLTAAEPCSYSAQTSCGLLEIQIKSAVYITVHARRRPARLDKQQTISFLAIFLSIFSLSMCDRPCLGLTSEPLTFCRRQRYRPGIGGQRDSLATGYGSLSHLSPFHFAQCAHVLVLPQ